MSVRGIFIISLDFELMWGLFDLPGREQFHPHVSGARKAIPKLLELFDSYGIHATWATVGFLFFKTKKELLDALPPKRPRYQNKIFSPYNYLPYIGENEGEDGLHFGASLIDRIRSTPGQEIGTHTFSHYTCLEKGADPDSFRDDLLAARKIMAEYRLTPKSLVFPKNQFNPAFLPILHEMGIETFRGNAPFWIYAPASSEDYNTLPKRTLRLLDAYLNITGHNVTHINRCERDTPLNIPRSRFLRPYDKRFKWAESVRFLRIKGEMNAAAGKGGIYHLCLHPHNFGIDTQENLIFLEKILRHFKNLHERYGMLTLNMDETYDYLRLGL